MDLIITNNVDLVNICRCCHNHNCYKDISSEYYYCNQKEVYENMLKETFDVELSQHNGKRPLICNNCIMRLRDAFEFKNMILTSERRFTMYLEDLERNVEVKLENVDDAPSISANFITDGNSCQEDGSYDDDEILANIKLELTGIKHDYEQIGKFTNSEAKTRKTKKRTDVIDCEELKQHQKEKDWLKISERRGNGPLLRENSLKLLANSTMCVFQWNKSRYRCFCCKEPFSDMDMLREHTNSKHTLKNIEKKIIVQQNRLVKVEVSLLFCKICNKSLENLNTLRDHLEKMHNMDFKLKEDLLVPFKIGTQSPNLLQCQICSETFKVFRLLNIHMNRHFQKQVCHICGAGFSNLVFLNLHKTRSHRLLNCKPCNLIFESRSEKRQHDVEFHDLKIEKRLRFPCPYCQERFYQEKYRVQHLVLKHGMEKPEYKCSMCPKVFITRSLCNNHTKIVHKKEKNQECDVCHHFFYSKTDVARHRVTHTGEKKFCCSLCNNLFATKDSLRRHLKRTHNTVQ